MHDQMTAGGVEFFRVVCYSDETGSGGMVGLCVFTVSTWQTLGSSPHRQLLGPRQRLIVQRPES